MKNKRLRVTLVVILFALIMSSCDGELELVLVTAITINSEGNQETVLIGETLQMEVQVQPPNASNKGVTWSVENVAGSSERENRAEITRKGVLTGVSAGTVVVKAIAKDGSGVEGTKEITVTEPEPETYTLTLQAIPTAGGTVSGGGTYEEGETVNISASANSGYRFVNWTKDGNVISTLVNEIYTMPAENVTLVANFEEEQAIIFECPVLEQAVRDADGYTGEPTGPIYPSDVLGITRLSYLGSVSARETDFQNLITKRDTGESLHNFFIQERIDHHDLEKNRMPRVKITSLEGIQYLKNLISLYFYNNNVSDITPVQNLTNLTSLNFHSNSVSDISPVQNLTNLISLYFYNNNVIDITPLQNLTNLTSLNFHSNNASNITPVQNLTNLTYLDFGNNGASNITPVQNLTNLTSLYFHNNSVSNITPVQNLTNLRYLYFGGNNVSNIIPIQNLTGLEHLFFNFNNVTSITPVQNLTNLTYLSFQNNNVSNITPIQNLTNLKRLFFGGNNVSNITPVQNLTGLERLYFHSNSVSNISPVQNLTNLWLMDFSNNQVSDISSLVANASSWEIPSEWSYWAGINMTYNNLDLTESSQNMKDINTLVDRGINVKYEPQK